MSPLLFETTVLYNTIQPVYVHALQIILDNFQILKCCFKERLRLSDVKVSYA